MKKTRKRKTKRTRLKKPVDPRAERFAALGLTLRTEHSTIVRDRLRPVGRDALHETRRGRQDYGITRWPSGESIFDADFE